MGDEANHPDQRAPHPSAQDREERREQEEEEEEDAEAPAGRARSRPAPASVELDSLTRSLHHSVLDLVRGATGSPTAADPERGVSSLEEALTLTHSLAHSLSRSLTRSS